MERRETKSRMLDLLAVSIRKLVREAAGSLEGVQEIRLRTGQPLRIVRDGKEEELPSGAAPHIVTKEELRETMEYISHFSLYAYENELRQGFLTVEGGHRVGVAGKEIMEKDKGKKIANISYVHIRESHV